MALNRTTASDFRNHASRLLEAVAETGEPLIVTKRGRPLVKVVPYSEEAKPLRGRWEGMGKSVEDIAGFNASDDWESSRPVPADYG